MPRDSKALARAARRRSDDARERAIQAIASIDRRGDSISFAAVAERANVSRQWLYTQADLREQIETLRAQQGSLRAVPAAQRASERSVRARLAVALEDNRRLRDEIAQLKQELAVALGEQRARREDAA